CRRSMSVAGWAPSLRRMLPNLSGLPWSSHGHHRVLKHLSFEYSGNIVDEPLARCYLAAMKLEDAAAHLEALGNPTRLKAYRLLVRAGDAGLTVGKLQDRLEIAAST